MAKKKGLAANPPTEEELEIADRVYQKNLADKFEWDNSQFELLSTMRYDPQLYTGGLPLIEAINEEVLHRSFFFLLKYHVKRLNDSRDFFEFNKVGHLTTKVLLEHVSKALEGLDELKFGPIRIQILVNDAGIFHINPTPALFPMNLNMDCPVTWTAYLDNEATLSTPFTSFKTSKRDAYNAARKRMIPEGSINTDVILVNTQGNISESSIANVALLRPAKNPVTEKMEMVWVTPPLADGCIEGCGRRWLMDADKLVESVISLKTVVDGETVLEFNAMRGVFKSQLVIVR